MYKELLTATESLDKEITTLWSHMTTLDTASNQERKQSPEKINEVQEMIKV